MTAGRSSAAIGPVAVAGSTVSAAGTGGLPAGSTQSSPGSIHGRLPLHWISPDWLASCAVRPSATVACSCTGSAVSAASA